MSSICRVNVQAPTGVDATFSRAGHRSGDYGIENWLVLIRLGAPLITGHYSEGKTRGDTNFSMLSHVCSSCRFNMFHPK